MNRIHPTAFVGPDVHMGQGNTVGPFAVILGPTVIGDGNWIGPHAVIGAPGEVRGSDHGAAWDGDFVGAGVDIGDRCVIRELVTIHQGTSERTVVGDDCFIMNRTEVSHDTTLACRVTLAPGVTLGGHSRVGERANVGIGAVTHQGRTIGPGAMVGMGSVVTKDVPPFAKAFGNPCRVAGANVVGLSRAGLPDRLGADLDAIYRSGAGVPDEPPESAVSWAWDWWRAATAAR